MTDTLTVEELVPILAITYEQERFPRLFSSYKHKLQVGKKADIFSHRSSQKTRKIFFDVTFCLKRGSKKPRTNYETMDSALGLSSNI